MERRLAAILATDVVGYSRLMEADEEGTLASLKSLRKELFEPQIAGYHGRIFKTTGDGLLCEFGSAVEAVHCAVAIQHAMTKRKPDTSETERLQIRVGINLGDVIVEDSDLIGDGVNVATRLEALAVPDGICISGTVHDHIAGKIDLPLANGGKRKLKNIERLAQLWHWHPDAAAADLHAGAHALTLPDRPSIAVLPFDNLSNDPDQEYFADGIAEDIITELSRFRLLFVTARNSSFSYRGQSVDVKQVARELGVQYVVEGSVRKAGNRIRLTVQLIDAVTGNHVWAERYDRELEDVFAVQDEITENIVANIQPEFLTAEMRRAHRKHEKNLDAWDYYMRALWHLVRLTKQDVAEAQRLARRAIELDPNGASQFSLLAVTHNMAAVYGWSESRDRSLQDAREAAEQALALDDHNAMTVRCLGLVNLYSRRHDDAIRDFKHAIDLCPTEAENHALLGNVLGLTGDYEEAVKHFEKAMRFSPRDVWRATWYSHLAMTASMTGRNEEAIVWARKAIQVNPQFAGGHRSLAASLGHLGRFDDARDALAKLLELLPQMTIVQARENLPIKHEVDLEHYLDGLRKAGLPE